MNPADFTPWLRGHAAAFPGVKKMLSALSPEERRFTEDIWRGALEGIDPRDAREATMRMLASADLQPFRIDGHPAKVREVAARARRARMAESGACRLCGGPGTVLVWLRWGKWRETLTDRDGGVHVNPRPAAVPCPDCHRGSVICGRAKRPPWPRGLVVENMVEGETHQDRDANAAQAGNRWLALLRDQALQIQRERGGTIGGGEGVPFSGSTLMDTAKEPQGTSRTRRRGGFRGLGRPRPDPTKPLNHPPPEPPRLDPADEQAAEDVLRQAGHDDDQPDRDEGIPF